MFYAPARMVHHGARGEHGEHGAKGLPPSLPRDLRDLRGEARLRFTKLDVALRHLTLLYLFIDSTKRSHRGPVDVTSLGLRKTNPGSLSVTHLSEVSGVMAVGSRAGSNDMGGMEHLNRAAIPVDT